MESQTKLFCDELVHTTQTTQTTQADGQTTQADGQIISLDQVNLPMIFDALVFACEKHRDQRRKDSAATPYINHPIGVARFVINIGKVLDTATICAALLHDTVEDTKTTYEELVENFGKEIADLVMECTDDKSLPKEERKRLQIVNASHKTSKAMIVKMADKLHNLRDLLVNPPADWPEDRIKEYFAWAQKVTDQMSGANEALAKELANVYAQFQKNSLA